MMQGKGITMKRRKMDHLVLLTRIGVDANNAADNGLDKDADGNRTLRIPQTKTIKAATTHAHPRTRRKPLSLRQAITVHPVMPPMQLLAQFAR